VNQRPKKPASYFIDPTGLLFATNRISQDVDMVTVRVNYRFGWGAGGLGGGGWGGSAVPPRY
jgi:hypothetical protein